MREAILEYKDHPEPLKDLKEKAKEISREYSEEHLVGNLVKILSGASCFGKKMR